MRMVKRVIFLMVLWIFKDYEPAVLFHNSFESQLCGTLKKSKNPHTIRKE